jgi:hypothetical protein
MPTWEAVASFRQDWDRLSRADKQRFVTAVARLVEDLRRGEGFRPGLRVKGVKAHSGVYEMTWAPDGRATFNYGEPRHPGDTHIVWRRIGRHDIFERP